VETLKSNFTDRFQLPSQFPLFLEIPIASLQVEKKHDGLIEGIYSKGQYFRVEVTLGTQRQYHFTKIPHYVNDFRNFVIKEDSEILFSFENHVEQEDGLAHLL